MPSAHTPWNAWSRPRELHTVRRRALTWLNDLADLVGNEVFADQTGSPLIAERDNLAAALADTADRDAAPYRRLPLELARVHYQQEQPSAARSLLDRLLQETDEPALGGAVAALATRVACQQSDLAQALLLGEQAVRLERKRGH
ncbi:hypothetical protein BX265_8578, partial [Streptomyces sp. TLI_235]